MQTLSIRHISEEKPRHIITECDDTDACKSCGAGYRVGLTACEYCRTAVQWPADGSMSPPIYGDGSGQALPCIKGDAFDEAPALTAEQVIIKLLRQLRTKSPHYREDVEAIEAGRAWLDGRANSCP